MSANHPDIPFEVVNFPDDSVSDLTDAQVESEEFDDETDDPWGIPEGPLLEDFPPQFSDELGSRRSHPIDLTQLEGHVDDPFDLITPPATPLGTPTEEVEQQFPPTVGKRKLTDDK